MDSIKLLHGTSEKNFEKISDSGLKQPCYLTDELSEAYEWARKTAKRDESKPAILETETTYACLKLDPLRLIESINYPDDVINDYDPDDIAKKEYEYKRKKGMTHKEIIDWGLKHCSAIECICDIPYDKIKKIEG